MEKKEIIDINLESPEVRLIKYQTLPRANSDILSSDEHFTPNADAQYANEAFQADNNNQQQAATNNNDKIQHSFYDSNLANDKLLKNTNTSVGRPFIIGVDDDESYQRNEPFFKKLRQKKVNQHKVHTPNTGSFEIVWRELSFEVDDTATITGSIRQLRSKLASTFCFSSFSGQNTSSNDHGSGSDPRDIDSVKQTSLVNATTPEPDLSLANYKHQEIYHQSPKVTSRKQSIHRVPNKHRVIFKHLNGYIRSGEVTAILGPSGAGKTSLLNALTGMNVGYQGQVEIIGGQKRKMRLSIIPQKDYLVETLTVKENLLFASKIKNHIKNFDHEANIEKVSSIDSISRDFCFCCLLMIVIHKLYL